MSSVRKGRRRSRRIRRARRHAPRGSIKRYLAWAESQIFSCPSVREIDSNHSRVDPDGQRGTLVILAVLRSDVTVSIVEMLTLSRRDTLYLTAHGVGVERHTYRIRLLDGSLEGFDCDPSRHGSIASAPHHKHLAENIRVALGPKDPRDLRGLLRLLPQY